MQRLLNAPDSFPLLAVPLFIMAAEIMNTGGITSRIFNFANQIVGHKKGGLGHVNVVASIIFSGMSGSAIADAGGLGLIEIQSMREENYDDDFIIGITGASSLIGPIIPPSVPAVVYGAIANVSIGGLFIGGIIPGLIMGLSLMLMITIIAHKRNYPVRERANLKEILVAFKDAFFPLLTPMIIIGGIWLGFFTPTEAAFIAVLYALILTMIIYREIKIKDLPSLILKTAEKVAPAIIIVCGASIFGWILNFERVDQFLINALFGISDNIYILLIIVNIFLLFIGMFIEPVAAILILVPILNPLSQALGMHPVHFGIMLIINLMIGLMTPPVGFILYILSTVADVPFERVVRTTFLFLIPILITLGLVTFIPGLVLYLPRLLGWAL
jgi:tripartite ATP-independent transporter DctM subunit